MSNISTTNKFIIFSILTLTFLLVSSQSLIGRNYYFSSSNGDDTRTSTQAQNPATPWKSISKLNSFFNSIAAGDSVLFKRGESFYGSIRVTSSGTSSSPIVIGAYGSGSTPVITGFTTLTSWTSLGNGIYQSATTSSKPTLNIVTVNGKNTPIGRFPNTGYLSLESHIGTTSITDNQLTGSPNWTGAEVACKKAKYCIGRNLITNHSNSTITYSGGGEEAHDNYGYFIQNDLRTLDILGEWYLSPSSRRLHVYFGAANPSSYTIKASSLDTLVYSYNQSYVNITNLNFEGANFAAFFIRGGQNFSVLYCGINFSGKYGINANSNVNFKLEHCSIKNSNHNAVQVGCTNASIRYNTIQNAGLIPGMADNGEGYNGIEFMGGDGSMAEYNTLDSMGGHGIFIRGNYVTLKNNLIKHFAVLLDDVGGIYTVGKFSKRKIIGNIVIDGVGSISGTTSTIAGVKGIMLEVFSSDVEIKDNTVSNAGVSGIHLNSSHDLIIRNNLLLNNRNQLLSQSSSSDPAEYTRNILIFKNIFFSKSQTQYNTYFYSIRNDIPLFGSADSNYYCRPISETNVIQTQAPSSIYHTLASWQSYSGKDSHSKKSPQSITNENDILFEYNASQVNKVVPLNAVYLGVDGTVFTSSYTLLPYRSVILIKSANQTIGTNLPPFIQDQGFQLNKNTTNSTEVGTVVASDPNVGQVLTYSIVSGNTSGAFAINASSGLLSVANATAIASLPSSFFSLIIRVQDNGTGNLSSQATVTVTLTTTVNQAPVINNQSFSVAQNQANGTTAGTVIATDPDSGQTLTFSIISGNTSGAFAINSSTGVLTVANSAALNSSVNPFIALTTRVQDNGTGNLSNQATVTVSVAGINNVPVINNQSFSINENLVNGTNIGTVLASDPDAGQTLTYSIVSGNTNNGFAINTSTGMLTVANSAALNFEVTPSFPLIVRVQDNGTVNLNNQATITVSLINVNETPVINNQLFSINENLANGTTVGTVVATDPDAAQTRSFSIVSGNTSSAYAINASTGVLTVANSAALNYQVNPSFALMVRVQDNGAGLLASQATITINILTATTTCSATGNITYQVWRNIGSSTSVSSLTGNANYPNNPTTSILITSMEGTTNQADEYGARIAGYICAPVTGNYTFWIASDNEGELWLSTNDQPANRQKIAFLTGSTLPRAWNNYASQKSVAINLVQGQKYYIEALMKEAYGGDCLAVGWLKPGQSGSVPSEVIPGSVLSPIGSTSTVLVSSVSLPTTSSLNIGSSVLLTATILPGNATNSTLNWTSSNTSVATVNSSGSITGVSEGTATITATSTDGSNRSDNCLVTVNSPVCSAVGNITYQVWNNIGSSTSVSSLTGNINYPNNPTSSTVITRMEGPTNLADVYGARIAGYICAPATGNYTFWIASDNEGELWLSTNDQPANRQKIAFLTGATLPRAWNNYASQKSVVINLIQGQKYYIEALMKEAYGGDCLAVGWLKPGQSGSVPSEVIPGSVLSPIGASSTVPVTSVTLPASSSLNIGSTALLTAAILPGNATNSTLNWTSSNNAVASVNSSGLVTGVSAGTATITATATDGSNRSDNCLVTVNSPVCSAVGSITYQVWRNIGSSTSVSSLTGDINYPNNPTSSTVITRMEGPTNQADVYGARIAGYICAPATGNYTFWIASDNEGELWLSTNDQPANRQKIAFLTGATLPRAWNNYASQKSVAINLVQGQKYYIEALMKEAFGGDCLAVGWLKPGQSGSVPSEVIPGSVLSPIGASSTVPVTSVTLPASSSLNIGSTALLTAAILPGNATNSTLNWTSSNNAVSSVNSSGLVTGVSAGTATITATSTDGSNRSDNCLVTVNSPVCSAVGSITYQVWRNIGSSTSVSSLTGNINFPDNPTTSTLITSMEGTTNQADQYGARIAGYICAPATGSYTFWIASDNEGELWLSTNDQPANKQKIAFVTGSTLPRAWSTYTSQKSAVINLVQGKSYYIEALMKEGYGGDCLAVGWLKPGQSGSIPSEVIPGSVLSPLVNVNKAKEVSLSNVEQTNPDINLSVYPNPLSNDELNIKIENLSSEATLKIFTVTGVEYLTDIIQSSGITRIDRSVFKRGIYIVKVFNESFVKSTKLVVN